MIALIAEILMGIASLSIIGALGFWLLIMLMIVVLSFIQLVKSIFRRTLKWSM